MDDKYRTYKRKVTEGSLTPWVPGFDMTGVSVSDEDKAKGSPKAGDMIARNEKKHADKWLVEEEYFRDHFHPEPVE